MAPGTVSLVGAGPGDPGLLTLAARDAIATADVIYIDALAPRAALAFASANATIHDVGKRGGETQPSEASIIEAFIAAARAGKAVVRLKGGDPFVFGRGGEEAEACRAAGIPFIVIPGVTSAVAGPAYAGIPVTHRGLSRSFAVVTGTTADNAATDWPGFAAVDTLVILMAARQVEAVARALIAAGRPPHTPAAVIRWATTPQQQSVRGTLATIATIAAQLGPPALLVVGETVGLHDALQWFVPGPLAGRSVVVTTSGSVSEGYAATLRALGANVRVVPLIVIAFNPPAAVLDALASGPGWLVFPSRNAVRALASALASEGQDARALTSWKLAVAGGGTSNELARIGLRADFQPSQPGASRLASELPIGPSDRVVILQSNRAGDPLRDVLVQRGAGVAIVEAYRTEPAALSDHHAEALASADAITLASPSAVESLAAHLRRHETCPARFVAIGPTTAAAARETLGRIDAVAASPSPTDLANAVQEALR